MSTLRTDTQPEGPIAADEILVAEHDPAVAELIRRYLAKEGLRVRCARTPQETAVALAGCRAAAVVLDLTMPGLDAREIRRLIRGRPAGSGRQPAARRGRPHRAVPGAGPGAVAPVICLTAGEGAQAAQGLRPRDIGIGQDACVARPFGPRTLVSKVRAVAPTARVPAATAHTSGRLRVEPAQRRATLDGAEIALTGTEFDVLTCLLRSAGRTVPRDRLHSAVWGSDGVAGGRIVDVYIAQLRAKLGPGNGIRTVRGIGYVVDPRDMAPGPRGAPPSLQPGGHSGGQKAPDTIVVAGHPIRGDNGTA